MGGLRGGRVHVVVRKHNDVRNVGVADLESIGMVFLNHSQVAHR